MKHLIIFLGILSLSISVFGQNHFQFEDDLSYAIVTDTDGYVNIREQPNVNSRIVKQLKKYQVFSCEPSTLNWWKVLFIDRQNSRSTWLEGFVYKDNFTLLDGLNKMYHVELSTNECQLQNNELSIVVKQQKFDPKQHKLIYRKEKSIPAGYFALYKIDNNWFWGTAGETPKEQIIEIKITDKKKPILIPKAAFCDLYEPNLETLTYTRCPGNTIYIKMNNSDGAGYYTVIWIIRDGKYWGRYIDDSEV